MSKRWASCSGLERLFHCAASSVLPQTRDSSHHAVKGQKDHTALEVASGEGVPDEIHLPSGWKIKSAELRLPTNAMAEIAYGYDCVSDEVTFFGQLPDARLYPDTTYSTLAGTADVVGIGTLPDGRTSADVVDFKTGFADHQSDSWQLRALSFMAWRHHKTDVARSRITYVRDGLISHEPSRLWTREEMEETGVRLRRKYDEVNKLGRKGEIGLEDVKRGPHCHFCPAFAACPYMASILSGGRLAHLDTRDLAEAYLNREALRTALSRHEEALKIAASENPIPLGDGWFYGKRNGQFRRYRE